MHERGFLSTVNRNERYYLEFIHYDDVILTETLTVYRYSGRSTPRKQRCLLFLFFVYSWYKRRLDYGILAVAREQETVASPVVLFPPPVFRNGKEEAAIRTRKGCRTNEVSLLSPLGVWA